MRRINISQVQIIAIFIVQFFVHYRFQQSLIYSRGKTELSEVNLYNIILDYLIYHEFI